MSTSGLTLAQQLKQLSSTTSTPLDPESAYTSLDSNDRNEREDDNEGREHYLDVGPSKLRFELDPLAGGTLAGSKYEGVKTGRMRIFDDDDDDEEEDEDEGDEGEGDDLSEDDGNDDDEEEDENEDEELDEDEDEDDENEDVEQDEEPTSGPSKTRTNGPGKTLDPLASLRDSRLKDIEKGQAIRRQKALFESLITLRITFQKAFINSTKIPSSASLANVSDPAGEIESKKASVLASLGELNERLFTLREKLSLPGTEGEIEGLGKRKRVEEGDELEEGYWLSSAKQSLSLVDANHAQVLPILNKWSSKIQAASLQLGSKQAGGSKFLQSVKNTDGVVEAIEAGLNSKREAEKTLLESEETGYRALLREVIESRSGSGAGVDLTHLRREKKKKREAERGGSKGRRLRYTVHEKAANFTVPIPLSQAWHDEQVDELFSSLFGGAGIKGAQSEAVVDQGIASEEGLSSLGGLKVF